MRRTRNATLVGSEASAGSLLVEALVGIALLGAVIVAAGQLATGTSEAVGRAHDLVGTVRRAERLLETTSMGWTLPDFPADDAVRPYVEDVEARGSVEGDDACSGPIPGELEHVAVRVRSGQRVASREVGLAGMRPAAAQDPIGDASLLRLRVSGEGATGLGASSVHVAGSTAPMRAGAQAVCATLGGIDAGRYDVVIEAQGTLIDRTHQSISVRPHRVTITGELTDRSLDVAPSGVLRISVDAGGARTPDTVGSGALRWFVRGDDARLATALGDAREVHPGPVTAVVSACLNPEALASSRTFDVASGGELVATVPLATVTLEGIGSRTDATVFVIRTTGCADGSGLRPTLRWNGALVDGMRIALPHGEWEARLQTASGSSLTSPVLFHAGGTDVVVRLP